MQKEREERGRTRVQVGREKQRWEEQNRKGRKRHKQFITERKR